MVKKQNNHLVPKCILKGFVVPGTKFSIYYLELDSGNIITRNIGNKDKYFNISDFYSTKSISEILNSSGISFTINPIFKDLEENLETNLSRHIENEIYTLSFKIHQNKDLTGEEIHFIKQYSILQFLRIQRFRDIQEEVFSEKNIPRVTRKNIADLANEKILNSKSKISPNHRNTNLELMKLRLKHRKYCNRDLSDKHTEYIINRENAEHLYKKINLKELDLIILINSSEEPFIISDTGIALIENGLEVNIDNVFLDYIPNNFEIYLPISSEICLKFATSCTSKRMNIDDVNEVIKINDYIRGEAYTIVFGSFKEKLSKYLVKKLKIK